MWRFWRALPPKGRIGIFFGSWYTQPIVERVIGKSKKLALDKSIGDINRFEQMLAEEGALIIKFWFHLSKKAQGNRLKSLEKDPHTKWRVAATDWERYKMYDKFRKWSEYSLQETSTGAAPWIVVEGSDACYRNLTVGKILLKAITTRLAQNKTEAAPSKAPPIVPHIDERNILTSPDMTLSYKKSSYKKELEKMQGRLNKLSRQPKFKKKFSLLLAYEGADAGGKGGNIRRITAALDARQYNIIPIAALPRPMNWLSPTSGVSGVIFPVRAE